VQDGEGISDFNGLSFAMRGQPDAIVLYTFDLLPTLVVIPDQTLQDRAARSNNGCRLKSRPSRWLRDYSRLPGFLMLDGASPN
jgi:hypothetical protein